MANNGNRLKHTRKHTHIHTENTHQYSLNCNAFVGWLVVGCPPHTNGKNIVHADLYLVITRCNIVSESDVDAPPILPEVNTRN